MCYVLECFGVWLDLFQRIISFCLTCFLCSVVLGGLGVMLAAGIAYGYNYSMAEFLTFKRSDMSVYIKRLPVRQKYEIYSQLDRRRAGAGEGPEEGEMPRNPAEIKRFRSDDYYLSERNPKKEPVYVVNEPQMFLARKLPKDSEFVDRDHVYVEKNAAQQATPLVSDEVAELPEATTENKITKPPLIMQAIQQVPLVKRKENLQKVDDPPSLETEVALRDLIDNPKAAKAQEPRLLERGPDVVRETLDRRVMHATVDPIIPTKTLPGFTDIVMRNYSPNFVGGAITTAAIFGLESSSPNPDIYKDYETYNENVKSRGDENKPPLTEAEQKRFIPMRHWGITQSSVPDDSAQRADDDNIVYRPI